jgi:hypothetical protein
MIGADLTVLGDVCREDRRNDWLRNGWDCLDNSTERDETIDSRTEPVNCISS